MTINDYGFYTAQELKELDDSDLSFEIAHTAILNVPEADSYLDLLIAELTQRNI
jgi:hypothetical protein